MEDQCILHISNDTHLFSLEFVFLPWINDSLKKFINAWNNHPISSEGNLTPIQLWTSGLMKYNQDPFTDEVSTQVVGHYLLFYV